MTEREIQEVITAPRAAIEQAKEQEPVAKVRVHTTGGNAGLTWSATAVNSYDSLPPLADGTLLYAAAQRQWVGLTDDDFQSICANFRVAHGGWVDMLVLQIEAKLKEKNT